MERREIAKRNRLSRVNMMRRKRKVCHRMALDNHVSTSAVPTTHKRQCTTQIPTNSEKQLSDNPPETFIHCTSSVQEGRQRAKDNRLITTKILSQKRKVCHQLSLGDHATTSASPTTHKRRSTAEVPTTSENQLSDRNAESTKDSALLDLGAPKYICQYCKAIFWFAERLKSHRSKTPVYSSCCRQGRIKLPFTKDPPSPLRSLIDYAGGKASRLFRDNIRAYNSMFAFTSIGGKIDRTINKSQGPYIFKISGQNHHMIGSMLPLIGERPHFAQLYIYDTDNEVNNRMSTFQTDEKSCGVDEIVVAELILMFDACNELVKIFRMARDRFKNGELHSLSLRLCGARSGDTVQYNEPTSAEMAGLIVGDIGQTNQSRDIIVEYQSKQLQRIDDLHPSFMAMQYPLLFPFGEDGYKLNIKYQVDRDRPQIKRGNVTRREYYSYVLHQRDVGFQVLIRGGKLFQQYIVDAFTSIEDERLRYIRFKHQQEHYRCDIYKGVQDAFLRGDAASNTIGQRVILPSSFTGSPRYMIQNYHDAMAICRSRGNPDLFITFTCNVKWKEIEAAIALIPGQKVEDRPDIVARVFNMKLAEFIKDIKTGNYFGRVVGVIYTVEFQKRGLPHVHIIVWLHSKDKFPTPEDIDRIITAEIPDHLEEPELYNIMSKFMIHGPCGLANSKAPCMKDMKCMKHFPKKFYSETIIGDDGFAVYRRRNDNRFVVKNGVNLDNRFVVPYNKGLLLKYQAHVNVEWCNRSRSIKYLFKYVNKGPDRTRAVLQETNESPGQKTVDEIKIYYDCRYLAAYESCWRIFEYHIHYKYPAVERLTIHMPLMNSIYFAGNKQVSDVLRQPGIEKTMLTEWMYTNSQYDDARELTYTDFPTFWRWDSTDKIWFRRKRGVSIGRISYVHPTTGDAYFLRMLLSHVKGAQNFTDVRTVDGVVYDDFKQACNAMGLIGDDREWHDAMEEAALWATSYELRNLFITLLQFCEVTDAARLFATHFKAMQDDIVYKLQQKFHGPHISLTEDELKSMVLQELQHLLQKIGMTLTDFQLPLPTTLNTHDIGNTTFMEELNYNTIELRDENQRKIEKLNKEQRLIYEDVLDSVNGKKGNLFFVYGHGGTGKTFVYQTLINKLRAEGQIVLAVASSGIASLLLPGGRTAHSRFKIPIDIHQESTCYIKKGTQLAELIKIAALILWDEAPMAHRNCFEALDRTISDIMEGEGNLNDISSLPFGGKTVVLGGDFRQILPVVIKGSRHDTVQACITRSELWQKCKVYELKTNMRLTVNGLPDEELLEMSKFAQWLLDIGEGKVEAIKMNEEEETPVWIKIPDEMLLVSKDHSIRNLITEIYDDLSIMYNNTEYLKDRAIITGTNEAVDKINSEVLAMIPSQQRTYLSFDSICKAAGGTDEDDILYPPEFLNSLSFSGVPYHNLALRAETPIMLLRNIKPIDGLCNGTRLMVKKLGARVIEAIIITGSHVGNRVYIPRIDMSATDKRWPFTMKRRQFPIRLCYAMTINKSQGQSLAKVGLYLPRSVFTHGQLYVAISRVTTYKGLKILLGDDNETKEQYTKNIVYQEIFDDL